MLPGSWGGVPVPPGPGVTDPRGGSGVMVEPGACVAGGAPVECGVALPAGGLWGVPLGLGKAEGMPVRCGVALPAGVLWGVPLGSGDAEGMAVRCGVAEEPGVTLGECLGVSVVDGPGMGVELGHSVGSAGDP